MNTRKSYWLIALMTVVLISTVKAQSPKVDYGAPDGAMSVISTVKAQSPKVDPLEKYRNPPRSVEKVIGNVRNEHYCGSRYDVYSYNRRDKRYTEYDHSVNEFIYYKDEVLIEELLSQAKEKYGNKYPKLSLRNFKSDHIESGPDNLDIIGKKNIYKLKCECSAQVVILDTMKAAKENLRLVIEKAMKNIPKGSRVSIDQVEVIVGIDKDDYKDQMIELLLGNGYKVVAKEFMQRLYEEQKQQQTGVYNEETTVQKNNFSAVGYYVNIRMTSEGLRMKIVNVSTGEYEGNAIINF